MCSCAPHVVLTDAASLRDFGRREKCWPLSHNCPLKVLQISSSQRLTSIGYASAFCESAGITFKLRKQAKCGMQTQSIIVNALPQEAVSTAGAIVIVGASAGALLWMNQDKLWGISSAKKKCEACNGSGLCAACKGEGFQLKSLSPEAVERARSNAKDAATRYTAGLAKKWNYCANCSGSRNCPACDGTGRLSNAESRS